MCPFCTLYHVRTQYFLFGGSYSCTSLHTSSGITCWYSTTAGFQVLVLMCSSFCVHLPPRWKRKLGVWMCTASYSTFCTDIFFMDTSTIEHMGMRVGGIRHALPVVLLRSCIISCDTHATRVAPPYSSQLLSEYRACYLFRQCIDSSSMSEHNHSHSNKHCGYDYGHVMWRIRTLSPSILYLFW